MQCSGEEDLDNRGWQIAQIPAHLAKIMSIFNLLSSFLIIDRSKKKLNYLQFHPEAQHFHLSQRRFPLACLHTSVPHVSFQLFCEVQG